MLRLLTLLILLLAPMGAGASGLPRVVSVNVCTDQLVMLLAEPSQIIALSPLADDPRASAMAAEAAAFAKTSASAEAIAVQAPDIVVAGQYNDPALMNMLRSIGVEIVEFPLVQALEDIPASMRKMGRVLAQEARAETMAAAFEAELAQFSEPDDSAPLAAFFFPNGYALGTGTLSHDILTAGGARNLSAALGMTGNGRLSLEQLVLHAPDLLIGAPHNDGFSRSEEMTTHPAIAGIAMYHSSADWVCETPHVLTAIKQVAQAVEALRAGQTE
ncbi:ABC transporter substrate-binding protein [Marivita sp. S2033]|uniref:ABC transporter substrate-binding protein n=1 Tax=Marivita sp. S2033 TaxID=3373187 RepID=UPI0039827017